MSANKKAERAVKSINLTKMKNPRRFQSEIDVAKSLDHPNVVRLFETFLDGGRHVFLVLELCTGGELFDRLVEQAPKGFDEHKVAVYIRQMFAAIAYLHSRRFAHRDIKLENFLLQNQSDDAVVKLIDFGFACQFKPGVPMTTKNGTPYYISPEVLLGSYDEKCDVWSCGVVSYVLFCGSPPFNGDNDSEILRKVAKGKLEFSLPPWKLVSADAKKLVSLALAMEPAERPSAADILTNAWLGKKGAAAPAPIESCFIERLKGFHAHSRMKKVALAVVAQLLPDHKVESLQNVFRALDKDGDGSLSAGEIRIGLEREGLEVPDNLLDILNKVDCNASGKVDYTEFVASCLDRQVYNQEDILWAAFRRFDLNGDGKITREELQTVLASDTVESTFGMDKIQDIIKEVDSNGDGVIDFDEFKAMMATPVQKRRRISGKRPVLDI